MDKIFIHGMEFYAYHGVFPAEQEIGQRYRVDIECSLDLENAGLSDKLQDTVNYAEIYELTKKFMEQQPPVQLIESLGQQICDEILKSYDQIEQVFIRVIKPNPPIPGHYKHVGIEMTRSRKNVTK